MTDHIILDTFTCGSDTDKDCPHIFTARKPVDIRFVRLLGRDLWGIGGRLVDGKVSRIIFCVDKGRMVLLHGFIKKSRKTSKKDIDLAVRRKKVEGL